MSQLTTRDYKGTAPRPRGSGGLGQFLWGALAGAVLAGLGAALIMHHADKAVRACTAVATKPAATPAAALVAPAPVSTSPMPGTSPGANARSTSTYPSSSIWGARDPSPHSHRIASPTPAARATGARSAGDGSNDVAPRTASQTQYDFYQMLPNLRVTVPAPSAPGTRSIGPGGRPQFAGYVLQAGAYSSEAHARKVVSYLNFLGTLAHIDTVHQGGKPLYLVRIGPVIERWELNRFRHQLKLIGLQAVVIPGATH